MEANRLITAFLFLNALSFGPIHSLAAQTQMKPEVHDRAAQSAHKEPNSVEKTNAQWFADPERGWVRTDEQRVLQKQNKSEAKQTVGKQKADDAKIQKH